MLYIERYKGFAFDTEWLTVNGVPAIYRKLDDGTYAEVCSRLKFRGQQIRFMDSDAMAKIDYNFIKAKILSIRARELKIREQQLLSYVVKAQIYKTLLGES